MRASRLIIFSLVLVLSTAGFAMAAEGGHLPWGDFLLRLINFAVVIAIIWYAAGGLIKKFFVGRKAGIVNEMDELARLKKDAAAHLAAVERKVVNAEGECRTMLAEGKAQAEALKASIIADAQKQAAAIIEQAKAAAEREGKSELDAIRNSLADEIVKVVERDIKSRLNDQEQQKLIDKALTRVVLQ